MADSTGSRILWAGILIPPLLLLGAAGAVTIWPERVIGVMDAASRAWSPAQTIPGPAVAPLYRVLEPPRPPEPTAMLRVTIRGPDGEPFRGAYRLSIIRRSARTGLGRDRDPRVPEEPWDEEFRDRPEFDAPLDFALTYLVIVADGYAPAVIGPRSLRLAPEPGAEQPGARAPAAVRGIVPPDPVDVTLRAGLPHEVRVVDSSGAPIFGAEVMVGRIVERSLIGLPIAARADEDGRVVFPALSDEPYNIAVGMHGYGLPDDAVDVVPGAGGVTTLTLERGPLSGVAMDEEGRPVGDALLLIAAEMDERLESFRGGLEDRIIVAKSDGEGRFTLPALHDHSIYLIRAEGPDGSLGFASGVRRSDGRVSITLRPGRVVRGIAYPDASGSPPFVVITRSVATGFPDWAPGGGHVRDRLARVRSIPVAPDGSFEYPTWASVATDLMVGGVVVPVPSPPPAEPLRIGAPAPEPAERTVRVQLRGEGVARPSAATITLRMANPPPERVHQGVERTVELHEGAGEYRCLASESFQYDSAAIPGYWTAPGRIGGGGPIGDRLASVRIFQAGSIVGRALDADGAPIAGAKILAPFDPEWARDVLWRDGRPADDAPAMDAEGATTGPDGRFVIPSFPLGVASRPVIEHGRYFATIGEIRPTSADPRAEVEFRSPRRVAATVRVVDPDGAPIPGARVSVSLRRSETEHREWPLGETDADGRCSVDDLAEGEAGYTVRVEFAAGFVPVAAPLKPGGPTLELRAGRGNVVEGRAVEAVTGWPIAGVAIVARSLDAPTPIEVEATTDADGRFRMTTLPAGRARLGDRRGLKWLAPHPAIVPTGAAESVLIRFIDLRETDPLPRPSPSF